MSRGWRSNARSGRERTGVSTADLELIAGESVEWIGRPEHIPWFVAADLFLLPLTFAWAAFAIVATVGGAMKHPAAIPFAALFAVIGVYISLGRLVLRRRTWRRARYALTTERLLVTTNERQESAWLDELPPPVVAGKHAVGFESSLLVQTRLAIEGWPLAGRASSGWLGSRGWLTNRNPVLVGMSDPIKLRQRISGIQNSSRQRRHPEH